MKKIILILTVISSLFFLRLMSFAQVPNWIWGKGVDENSISEGRSCATDADNNILVLGGFCCTTLAMGNDILVNKGSSDMLLAKFDPAGNVLWARSAGSPEDDMGGQIAIDGNNNIAITGEYSGPFIVFGSDTLFANTNDRNIFVAKYNEAGNVLWAKGIGGEYYNQSGGIAFDKQGNLIVGGNFTSPQLIIGNDTLINQGWFNSFVLKLDASGNVILVKQVGSNNRVVISSVACDNSNNFIVTGNFLTSPLIFDNDTVINDWYGDFDFFTAKYNSTGSFIWAKISGGTDNEFSRSVSIDKDNNVIITGDFSSPVLNFGSDTLHGNMNGSVFLAKLDSLGNYLWAKATDSSSYAFSSGVVMDAGNNIIITGEFDSPVIIFDSDTLYAFSPDTTGDVFVVEYNAAGQVIWAKSAGGNAIDYPSGIACDKNQDLIITGVYKSKSIVFGNDTLAGDGSHKDRLFLAKLSASTDINDITNPENSINLFPNPATTTLTIECTLLPLHGMISIFNIEGKLLMQKTIKQVKTVVGISSLAKGMYFIKVTTEREVGVRKFVKE